MSYPRHPHLAQCSNSAPYRRLRTPLPDSTADTSSSMPAAALGVPVGSGQTGVVFSSPLDALIARALSPSGGGGGGDAVFPLWEGFASVDDGEFFQLQNIDEQAIDLAADCAENHDFIRTLDLLGELRSVAALSGIWVCRRDATGVIFTVPMGQ
jgi:hypothetical protein